MFVRLCVFAFAAYVAVTIITLQMEISSKQTELVQIEEQSKDQERAKKELERQIALGDDENHLARIARDKLDMGFADEHVYRDVSGS